MPRKLEKVLKGGARSGKSPPHGKTGGKRVFLGKIFSKPGCERSLVASLVPVTVGARAPGLKRKKRVKRVKKNGLF